MPNLERKELLEDFQNSVRKGGLKEGIEKIQNFLPNPQKEAKVKEAEVARELNRLRIGWDELDERIEAARNSLKLFMQSISGLKSDFAKIEESITTEDTKGNIDTLKMTIEGTERLFKEYFENTAASPVKIDERILDNPISVKDLIYSLRSCVEDLMLYMRLHKFAFRNIKEVVKLYDFITLPHVRSVVELSYVVKDELKLGYIEAELLELLGWLHDVGKSVKVENGEIIKNDEYLSVLLTPQKLEYSDSHLQRLMKEHASHSLNVLEDGLGYRLPLKLQLPVPNHHPFAIVGNEYIDFFSGVPDYRVLPEKGKKEILRLAHIFMVIDAISAYTEASRPTNWFDNIVIDVKPFVEMIEKRYGKVFEIN
ncbi:MAG: HD domain-containing protein, partial [Candidatus Omnitrophota bacterium]|nr:HD domain-containing protein [Candidatus Omnitrophota bacterium]